MRFFPRLLLTGILSYASVLCSKEISCDFSQQIYLEIILSNLPRSSMLRHEKTCEILNAIISDDQFEINSTRDVSIEAFNIKHNKKVEFVPRNLAEAFPKLKMLQVFNSSIKVISNQAFINLTTLQELHLAMNEITVISEFAFKDVANLLTLNLANNKIVSLTSTVFYELGNLKTLYLSDNIIEILQENLFNPLKKLENLILCGNKIQTLSENLFVGIISLGHVSISRNKIEEIDDNLFIENTKLDTIWLHHNKINFINHRVFKKLPKLQWVDLSNNLCVNSTFGSCPQREYRSTTSEACANNSIHNIGQTLQLSCPPYNYTTRYYSKEFCREDHNRTIVSTRGFAKQQENSLLDNAVYKLFFGMWRHLLFH